MASRMRRGIVALFLASVVFAPLLAATDAGAGASRAGIVVNHDQGPDTTECVRFQGDRIKAIDLLTRSTLAMYTEAHPSFKRSICWLDGEGFAPGSPCFDPDPGDPNWGIWLRKRGQAEPRQASVGVSFLNVRDRGVLHVQFAPFGGPPDFVQPTPAKVRFKSICGS